MTVCVPLPQAGVYGIAVRHDVNGNGKTDITRDGGGMSNNPSINIFNLGKPSYKKTAFSVGDAPKTISISMKYMRSEEHTSELQSLMRISYAVFCLKKKKITT